MKIIYISCITLLIALSCNKEGGTNFKLSTIDYLETKDIFNYGNCFLISNIHAESGFVIKDESTYQIYADSMRIQPLNTNCDTATLTDIDFTKYSLLGILTGYGACDSITRDISVNNQQSKVIYSIDIKESTDTCIYIYVMSLNLALVSRIPDDFAVKFFVNRHQK